MTAPVPPGGARLVLAGGTHIPLTARLDGQAADGLWQWRLCGPPGGGRIEVPPDSTITLDMLPARSAVTVALLCCGSKRYLLPADERDSPASLETVKTGWWARRRAAKLRRRTAAVEGWLAEHPRSPLFDIWNGCRAAGARVPAYQVWVTLLAGVKAGTITSEKETLGAGEGRPARTFYRLTGRAPGERAAS